MVKKRKRGVCCRVCNVILLRVITNAAVKTCADRIYFKFLVKFLVCRRLHTPAIPEPAEISIKLRENVKCVRRYRPRVWYVRVERVPIHSPSVAEVSDPLVIQRQRCFLSQRATREHRLKRNGALSIVRLGRRRCAKVRPTSGDRDQRLQLSRRTDWGADARGTRTLRATGGHIDTCGEEFHPNVLRSAERGCAPVPALLLITAVSCKYNLPVATPTRCERGRGVTSSNCRIVFRFASVCRTAKRNNIACG